MPTSPKEPIPWVAALVAAAILTAGCGPVDGSAPTSTPGAPPWDSACVGGKCDGLEGVTLIVCGARDVATQRGGCTRASAVDIGVDPLIAEKKVPFYVGLQGLDVEGVAVSLELVDPVGDAVRSLALDDIRDGQHVLYWDGLDAEGADVVSPWHNARLVATYGPDSITSEGHTIATLVNLPDEGPGYNHPLGTDRQDTDDWGRAHVIEALTTVGTEWPHDTPIAFLDLSLQNGGEFRPHWNHRHGECVDFRYVRDDGEGKLDLRWAKEHYDRPATQALVDALMAHGAIEIYADERAELAGDFIVLVEGHTNHLHARFGLTTDDAGAIRPVNQGRAGGPCADDSDCNLREGFCIKPDGADTGTCTRPCEGACSDFVGGSYTLTECAATPDGRLCVPALDLARYPDTAGCRDGLVPMSLASLDHDDALTDVCWLEE